VIDPGLICSSAHPTGSDLQQLMVGRAVKPLATDLTKTTASHLQRFKGD
jgi:hypothetical protein